MNNHLSGRKLLFAVLTLALGAVLALATYPTWTQAATPDPVTAAWQRARAAGSYQFTSDITQVTLPLATPANIGRTSRSERLYLEGQNDLRARQMAFTLWSEGGNALQAESGVSVRTEGDKTYARRGAGDWKLVDDLTGAIAPQGDFMGYLAAIQAVEPLGDETRSGIEYTRYSFAIDSPHFALYMHEQTLAALRASGELPPGMNMEVPAYFNELTGSGELWVGRDGLPLRQVLTLQFPPQDDVQVHAQVVVNFSRFGQAAPAATGAAAGAAQAPAPAPALPVNEQAVAVAMCLGLLAAGGLLLSYRRTRPLQIGVAALVIFAQVGGPVLTTHTSVRFFAAQTAKAAAQEERQAAANDERELREILGKVDFNPHLSPLENRDWRLETGDWRLGTADKPISNLHSPISPLPPRSSPPTPASTPTATRSPTSPKNASAPAPSSPTPTATAFATTSRCMASPLAGRPGTPTPTPPTATTTAWVTSSSGASMVPARCAPRRSTPTATGCPTSSTPTTTATACRTTKTWRPSARARPSTATLRPCR